MRTPVVLPLVSLLAVACARPVPFDSNLQNELGRTSQDLAALDLRVLGTFELTAANRATIVIKNETKTFGARAVDDTTITLQVSGASVTGTLDTLALTFSKTAAGEGVYTLRKINDSYLGQGVPVGTTRYQYQACYANVGAKCQNAVPASTREDRTIHIGVLKAKK